MTVLAGTNDPNNFHDLNTGRPGLYGKAPLPTFGALWTEDNTTAAQRRYVNFNTREPGSLSTGTFNGVSIMAGERSLVPASVQAGLKMAAERSARERNLDPAQTAALVRDMQLSSGRRIMFGWAPEGGHVPDFVWHDDTAQKLGGTARSTDAFPEDAAYPVGRTWSFWKPSNPPGADPDTIAIDIPLGPPTPEIEALPFATPFNLPDPSLSNDISLRFSDHHRRNCPGSCLRADRLAPPRAADAGLQGRSRALPVRQDRQARPIPYDAPLQRTEMDWTFSAATIGNLSGPRRGRCRSQDEARRIPRATPPAGPGSSDVALALDASDNGVLPAIYNAKMKQVRNAIDDTLSDRIAAPVGRARGTGRTRHPDLRGPARDPIAARSICRPNHRHRVRPDRRCRANSGRPDHAPSGRRRRQARRHHHRHDLARRGVRREADLQGRHHRGFDRPCDRHPATRPLHHPATRHAGRSRPAAAGQDAQLRPRHDGRRVFGAAARRRQDRRPGLGRHRRGARRLVPARPARTARDGANRVRQVDQRSLVRRPQRPHGTRLRLCRRRRRHAQRLCDRRPLRRRGRTPG